MPFAVHEILADPPSPTIELADVFEIVSVFERDVATLASELDPAHGPLRVPKGRLAAVLACEHYALASLTDHAPVESTALGVLLDRVVHFHLLEGLPDPGDAFRIARDAVMTEGQVELLEHLDGPSRPWLETNLTQRAEHLIESFGAVDASWNPQCERRIEVPLAGGAVIASGIVDARLGGPLTGRPTVLIEVKAGNQFGAHIDDLRWYALLTTMRDGRPPACLVNWSAADNIAMLVTVNPSVLEAAARRGIAALEQLVLLANGAPAERRSGPQCRWCPARDRCAVAVIGDDDPLSPPSRDDEDDPGAW